ncbi:MAG: helix-turn-helix domain-containing protein [Bacteroidaceae bacterium]|nr:helix-turn-helix domain-containing protein [Bacteroidaceae bacterium]
MKTKKQSYPSVVSLDDELHLLGDLSKLPIPQKPHRCEHIILALYLQGEAQFTIDTRERHLKAGDLIVIQKDRVTADFKFSDDLQGIAIICTQEFFDEMVKDVKNLNKFFFFSRIQQTVSLSDEEIKEIKAYFKLIKAKIQEEDNPFRRNIVQTLTMALIYEVNGMIQRNPVTPAKEDNKRCHDIFVRFINALEENYRKERRVGWYAEQINLTPKYLAELIKQASQHTPNEWIDYYVIREIKVQLKNTAKSIKEITEDMNFPSQSFLGKYFKERVGLSPKEYRHKN